jgi:hypothetical protein
MNGGRLSTLAVRCIDFLFVWRVRCRRCKHRRGGYVADGCLCLPCWYAEAREREEAKIMQPRALANFAKAWAELQAVCANSPRPQAAQPVTSQAGPSTPGADHQTPDVLERGMR